MEVSSVTTELCAACLQLNTQRLTHPIRPCHNPSPCSTPPIDDYGTFLAIGSIAEIKRRRFSCDMCKLIADSLDEEPTDLDGECYFKECHEFCSFQLPRDVRAQDPNITHFHFTQLSVILGPLVASQFHGPSLPWELKVRDVHSSRYILDFQIKVKARSCSEVRHPITAPPQTEHDFLNVIGGRYVSTQVNAQLIRAWLHQCETRHGRDCMPALQPPIRRDRKPTFVVDAIQSCLVDTPSQCRYVALSYVWGTAPVFRHLLRGTEELRKTGSLRSSPVPATIRDAMTLVNTIGERYLWVDSLCIVQDDLKMQQVEIMQMGSIYSNALFTIVAAVGDHANNGLPGLEQGSREQAQKILRLPGCELLTVIDVRRTPSGINDTTWAQRAWTFQEHILSPRMLIFSENQIYWNCRAASHSEERALEEVLAIRRPHLPFPRTTSVDYLPRERLQLSEYRDTYKYLLLSYRRRYLTYQTDILNAFNGISDILSETQDDTFYWGLPASLFSYAMTWSFTGRSARNYVEVPIFRSDESKEMVPIPSWSWAAWSGMDLDYPFYLHAGDSTHIRPLIHFNIVDREGQLIRIEERLWQERPYDRIRAPWENEQPQQLPPFILDSHFRMGYLYFWTSLAHLRVVRHWRLDGMGDIDYKLFPPPSDLEPDKNTHDNSEIVNLDFIVVAMNAPKKLVLLAIEWVDGVAYRVGKTEVDEEAWIRVENKQWQLIILG